MENNLENKTEESKEFLDSSNNSNKKFIGIIIVLVLLLAGTSGVMAYQYFSEKIQSCGSSGLNSSDICYDVDNNGKKVSLKNLSKDKKYRLIVKRKINGDENNLVDVGETIIDMRKITEKIEDPSQNNCVNRNESSDKEEIVCCEGLEKRVDDTGILTLFVCCEPSECVLNGLCIANGIISNGKKCENGNFVDDSPNNSTCSDENSYSNIKSDLSCCPGLEIKDDLWNDENFINFGCCKPEKCMQDFVCVANGSDFISNWGVKCVDGEWEGTLKQNTTCSDSDGGKDYYTKGHLIWTTQNYEVDDYCVDNGTGEVMEHFCHENMDMYGTEIYICPYGCEDGACKLTY